MGEEDDVPQWRVRETRERYEKRRQMEMKEYGEDEYARRVKATAAVIDTVCGWVKPLVSEARERGFVYFRCGLKLMPNLAVGLEFADGKGQFYERSIGLERLMRKHLSGPVATLPEYTDVSNAVHRYVRGLEGIKMLNHGMKAKRVRANIRQ
jgi:hypothetical protein